MNSPIRKLLPSTALLMMLLVCAAMQTTDAATDSTGNAAEKITITGKRNSERFRIMFDFVGKLGNPVDGFGYARLEVAPCYRLNNITPPEVEYVTARLAVAVQETGLAAARPGCQPNVLILFVPDGKALADYLVKNHNDVIHPFVHLSGDGTTQDMNAVHDFATSDAPVRWWQIAVPVDWSGTILLPPLDADSVSGFRGYVTQGTESRIKRPGRDRLLTTLIIVDASKVGDITWDQLSDYLAMVSLVQVKPHTNLTGYDSILNLFSQDAALAPPALSDWDKAYLRAVYALDRYLMPQSQRGALTNRFLENFFK